MSDGCRDDVAQCRMCQNRCRVTLTVDAMGIVVAARRPSPDGNEAKGRSCQNLSQVVGKSVVSARRRIDAPVIPRIVPNGH